MEVYHAGEMLKIKEPTSVILGMFDGVHIGHRAVISAAQKTGLKTVLITFTEHPALILKNRMAPSITTPAQREKIMDSLGIDYLIYLDFKTVQSLSPDEFIQKVLLPCHPQAAFCGFNYSFGMGGKAGPDELKALGKKYGFKAVSVAPVCDDVGPVSSTRIRRLIEAGKMEKAARLLGRPFSLCLPVVHGRQLGRELGMPTINQSLPEGHVCPRFGVYASTVQMGGRLYQALSNVGVKPTVGSDHILCETYILDFQGDLYDQMIEVSLYTFLRPEMRFDSIDILKKQMHHDLQTAKNWLAEHLNENIVCAGK
ncbi:MAG TPA: riboflavin biosynthesis protein RibF [Ruminococcaceae bacterium]|nr:riboflavin biosynthesis protein RibF [Oscillospiraceae bacterium]